MNVALLFADKTADEIKELLAGGTLKVYSVARPSSPDLPVDRSSILANFTFASPAFGPESAGLESPAFVENPVLALHVGTPGFARAYTADGTVVADFSAGPGKRDIKFAEVSCSEGAPVKVTQFQFLAENGWPERVDYYNAHPRSGYTLPTTP
ncbi:MAG: hypothetical protein ACLQUZ_11840 [Rhizomicrobium sp.]